MKTKRFPTFISSNHAQSAFRWSFVKGCRQRASRQHHAERGFVAKGALFFLPRRLPNLQSRKDPSSASLTTYSIHETLRLSSSSLSCPAYHHRLPDRVVHSLRLSRSGCSQPRGCHFGQRASGPVGSMD